MKLEEKQKRETWHQNPPLWGATWQYGWIVNPYQTPLGNK